MSYQIFAWDRSRNKLRQEIRWLEFMSIAGLFIAALALFCLNLGNVPLQPGTEQLIAQMAKEMAATPLQYLQWLFPTQVDRLHLTYPPLSQTLVALAYWVGEPNIWTTRLPGALLAASSVPLLYTLAREIFISRRAALFSALIFLTLLPVVRYGRLAMPDGAILCFEILTLTCVLRSRRDLRWALGAGLGLSLLGLTQGLMGLTVVAVVLLFLGWDTPRLLSSVFFGMGIFLGSAPAIAWYSAQWIWHGQFFLATLLTDDFKTFGEHSVTLSWFHLAELIKYSLPWLIFSLSGMKLAWRDRNWSWAKLILVWCSVCLIFSLFGVPRHGAIVPLYPALALAGGVVLAEIVGYPIRRPYPRLWAVFLGLLALIPPIVGISLYFERNFALLNFSDGLFLVILGALSLTWGMGAILLARRSEQFIPILFWGMYVCLILLVSSPYWA
jgi:4-amino-4-deoxy-L-arabinose transferase-like glycosyltransferase